MKLRIIIPTRGDSPWFMEALASAVAIPGGEIIVVAPVTPVGLAGDRVVCLPDEGRGIYAALNRGVAAPGDWDAFTWINDDDVLVPEGIATEAAHCERHADVGVAFGRVRMIDSLGRVGVEMPATHRGLEVGPLMAAGVVPFSQPGTLIRRAALERVGGFDERFQAAGDLDLFGRMAARDVRFEFVDAQVARFRTRPGQISANRAQVVAETSRVIAAAAQRVDWCAASASARRRFRWHNLAVYLGRIRRHGFVRMEALYGR